tara:strand:+ start:69102 stop:72353 length:3252 start_codon:yes stop_codon:yes gene_type:complete
MSLIDPNTDSPYIVSPNTIVRASAGSGKTFYLTTKFIKLLIEGESPSGMLATTFTRAAAGEVMHRVLERLSNAVTDKDALHELSEATDLPELSAVQCADVLATLIDQLHRLSIMTIDSFFARMAGSFSLELGLPMQYRLLEEDEADLLQEQCVDQAITDSTISEMVELLRSMQGNRIQMQTHSAIMKVIKAAYAMYLATDGKPEPWNSIGVVGKAMNEADLLEAASAIEHCSVPLTKAKKPNGHWVKAQKRCIDLIAASDWNGLIKGGLGSIVGGGLSTGEFSQYYNLDITHDLRDALIPIIEHARFVLTTEHVERTKAIYKLMQRFDSVYRTAKMTSGQLTFDDPPRLLNESRVTGNLEHLYYRLDASIRHVMLDEFQDTSMPQFKLLEPILDELLSQDEEARSVFIVGDAKQSLYSWRQAEPKLLSAMTDRWENFNEESLAKSWRSSSIVLDAVNDVFGDLLNNDAFKPIKNDQKHVAQQAAINWDEQYQSHRAAKTDMPGHVSLIVADGDPESSDKDAEEVLWACATSVQEAKAQSPNASIAVLVRQGKHIYPLLAKLSALGVDACEDRGNPLVDAPSVAAAVSMLQLIDHPSNTAALHHVRSTPLGDYLRLQNPHRIHTLASDLRKRITNEGCVPMLTQWLNACAPDMDQRGYTRFNQLIELAGKLQDDGRRGPAVLAMVAQTRKIDEPGHSPVRVITIHRSKGLEFDVVVLPLLGQPWGVRPDSILSRRDHPLGSITQVSRYPSQPLQSIHPQLQALHDHTLLAQINEELCCLYVAMTRAKSSLQMIVPSDSKGRQDQITDAFKLTPAHIIRAALQPDVPCSPGTVLYESSSDEHWATQINAQPDAPVHEPQESIPLRIQSPKTLRAGQLKSLTPSKQHGSEHISASSLLEDSGFGSAARMYGECLHRAFEQFNWIDDKDFDFAIVHHALVEFGYPEELVTPVMTDLTSTLESPIAALLTRSQWISVHSGTATAKVFHEQPFAIRLGHQNEERLVQGRFDRLVVGRDEKGTITSVHIVDYKTDRGAKGLSDSALIEFANKHKPQMDIYRQAAAKMYHIDESAVRVSLVFTSAPGVVDL